MMKSFFKKLSLVMALALVVSAMAPAASAFAAELVIAGQEETKAEAKEVYNVDVDAEIDFKFFGANAGWQDLYKWESADETIAKVVVNEEGVQEGKFLGVKDGEVEITLTIGEQKATVKLVVGEGETKVDASYEVKQIAGDKVTITWADATLATKDVTLYKIYNLTSGVVEVKWPCEVSLKDGVATVDAYVAFTDGEEYALKFGEETCGFVAYVGTVTQINVVPVDEVSNSAEKLYACDEAPYRPIRFDVEFITDGGVKVAQPEGTSMYYEVIEADDGVEVDNTGACSYITVVGASARIKAIYYYTDANGDTQELTDEFAIVGFPVPVATLDGVAAHTITADSTKVADAKWGKAELIVGEGAYVALKLADTLGGTYYTDVLTLGDKDVAYEDNFGEITYMSSDESKLLVGEYDGYVTAISSEGSAVVIVKLTYEANETTVTKNIYAFEVNLKAERKADKVTTKGVTVLTSDNASGSLDAYAEVKFTVADQYGVAWTEWDKIEVKKADEKAPTLVITQDVDDKGNLINAGTIAVDGTAFASYNKPSATYTINIDGAKANFTVTLKNPPVVTGSTDVKTTGYLVEATGTDVDGSKAGVINATINAYTTWTSNGVKYKVGNVDVDKLFAYNHKDYWKKNTAGLEVGDVVVMVTKPNGEFIVPSIDAEGNITVPVATVEDGKELDIEATGTYTVTLYTVTGVKENNDATETASASALINKLSKAETTFSVNNKCANMSISKYADKLESDAETIEQVILDLVSFKLGKDDYEDEVQIVDVVGVFNDSADKYYVKSIVIKTPIGKTGCYFKQTLTIGKTFTVENVTKAFGK